MDNTDIPREALWLPSAHLGSFEKAAAKAVEDYDSTLTLGQRRDTGEWLVFKKNGPGGEPFPVLGLGNHLPSADEVTKKLYTCDVRRHGEKIFRDIQRRNDERAAAMKYEQSEKVGVMAEHLDHAFRQQGVHPSPRIFLPAGINRED